MRSVLKSMQRVGAWAQRETKGEPFIRDMKQAREVLGPDFHVPAPGRVQYYRAEALPFVPHEIKNQLRFPKAYAMSFPNLRYLDAVRQETERFMQ